MIAEQKRPSEKSQGVGLPDTIFAGLSFPVAPTSDIIIKKNVYGQISTNISSIEDEFSESEMKVFHGSHLSSSNPLIGSTATSNISNIVTPASQRYTHNKSTISSQDIKKHLSKLYNNHDVDLVSHQSSSSLYPELPDLKSLDISTHETSSLLSREVSSTNSPSHSVSTTNVNTNTSEDSEQLVSDLIAQNARLLEEMSKLKNREEQHEGRFDTEDEEMDMDVAGRDVNNPAIGVPMGGGPETISENNSGTEKIKYISCGQCRFWFFAPKGSIYVLCPQCNIINNCGTKKSRSSDSIATVDNSGFSWLINLFPCFKPTSEGV